MANANLDKISVNVDITLTLDLPPETAMIVSSIRVGDRTFFPGAIRPEALASIVETTALPEKPSPRKTRAVKRSAANLKGGGGNLQTEFARTRIAARSSRRRSRRASIAQASARKRCTRKLTCSSRRATRLQRRPEARG